ncbi:hypothetical protein FIBSPDRAFT_909016 [Athelia psychrophila]|uniref:Uncharacterized protein n=1 Tax=Athelia psychrophila TaxID=1759441 RepID=A0A166QFB1_9AGAM|nr:hypothetical protein FIBSPDRAFT_909016 [Fibularhizoctonia sp. CBS 109695]
MLYTQVLRMTRRRMVMQTKQQWKRKKAGFHTALRQLSDDHLKAFIWVLKECGACNVPSFFTLRKKQKELSEDDNIKTKNHTSPLGNQFFMNGPADLFKLDFANPLVRDALELYPDLTGTSVSEFWQAGKWIHESDLGDLSPMWANFEAAPHQHFYVNEIAQVRDSQFGIPLCYGKVAGVEVVKFYEVKYYEATSTFVVRSGDIIQIEAECLTKNMLDLEAEGFPVEFEGVSNGTSSMLHPVRKITHGRPAFVIRMMPWSDVSGNRSKQYNPHTNVYLANTSLPHQKLQQEYFVCFSSTSPHAFSSEQLHTMSKDVQIGANCDKWHLAFDCRLRQEIIFCIVTHVLPADNPQQSETCSYIGLKGNQFCRHCDAGGTDKHKETKGGYEAMYSPGTPREVSATVTAIEAQLFTACLGAGDQVKVLQTDTGIKDKTTQYWINQVLLRASELKRECITDLATRDNQLKNHKLTRKDCEAVKNEVGLAVQKEVFSWLTAMISSCLTHILHTYLLGQDKHVCHDTNSAWGKTQDRLFATRLQGSSIDGLSIPPIRAQYIVFFLESLIILHGGLGIFHLYEGLCSKLGVMLWFYTIKNMDLYLEDLTILIANLLDVWSLHIIVHVVEAIHRFGPIFECWNTIFRCAVLDIGITLANMEQFKHQNAAGSFVRGSEHVRSYLQQNPMLKCCLGWVEPSKLIAGVYNKLCPKLKQNLVQWKDALAHLATPQLLGTHPALVWHHCRHIVSRSVDICRPGSWIFFRDTAEVCSQSPEPRTMWSHIENLSSRNSHPHSQRTPVVIIERFFLQNTNDDRLNMPILSRVLGDSATCIAKPEVILFLFNAQHDYAKGKCGPTGVRNIRKERIITSRQQKYIVHTDDRLFFLNMHTLHNADIICKTLPQSQTKPVPYFMDRQLEYRKSAAVIQVTGPVKRAASAGKLAAT